MTEVPLKDYFEAQLRALDRLVETKIKAIERATEIALATLNERLAGMNEFRAALKDQVATFANKESVERRLSTLENNQARAEGRAAVFGAIGGAVASLVASLAVYYLTRTY